MLGQLEMDINECIEAYVRLMKKVFENPLNWSLKSLFGKIESQLDGSKLEGAINEVIHDCRASIIEPFNNQAKHSCQV